MKTVRKGDTGKEVKQVQTALQIGVDGIFGNLTDISVRKFQDHNDLDIDGIVGPLTWEALKIDEVKEEEPTPSNTTTDSNYLWIFDNGHGGIIDGVYQTAGKRSPKWDDGSILYEGEFNRAIVNRLMKLCTNAGIECVNLVDTQEDISLSRRTDKANDIYREQKDKDGKSCIYVSVHANGFSDESANGWSVYTSEGETKSDIVASVLAKNAAAEFPDEKMRKDTRDGDADKESNFWVLRKTVMPSILSENFFMTNYSNCHNYLLSEEGRDRIAKIHFQMIQEVEEKKLV
jgi:N-acetylmuramoyl-L-alanine amidase